MYGNVMTHGDSDMPIAQPVGCRLCSRNDDDDDDEAEEKDVMSDCRLYFAMIFPSILRALTYSLIHSLN